MKRHILVAAVVSLFASGVALAADPKDPKDLSVQSAKMDSLATSQGNVKVESRISSDFNTFAGSTANSSSLVSGLRNGSPITLTSTDAKGVVTETTFTPSTGKMGYGNVFISLGLAQQQLTGLGITQPTTQDIRAALIGGDVTVNGQTTTLKGVLTYRSEGMGWGQIANTLGFKLGPVISGIKSANAHVSAPTTAATSTNARGVTSAGGASSSNGVTNAAGSNPGQGNAYGRGITTGAGGAAGQGGGNAYGHGITTGSGGAPGQSGTAGSQARGAGKGG
jgi:hypothetical protein